MSTFYLNHSTGDDANDGSSWALAWKTITLGATAARIAPGDIIKIAKTPDPTLVGDATWTNTSKTVTLATACTAVIDMCATAWTPASNVTCTTTATRKEGSLACEITIGSSFTDGKIAYKTITTTDFSGYQQVSFWIRSTVALVAMKICLCSDTLGATPVDELTLPAISTINQWYPVTINKGSALGASIQSVALYETVGVDPGTPVITIDNVIACKAVGSADSLSLTSLISKNSAATGGTHSWHGIQSINGTTVMLDNTPMTLADAGRGYSGTTETVATYKRETVKITAVETINDSGTEASPIDYQCGINTATGAQDGETFLDGQIATFNGLYINTKNFTKGSNLSIVRCSPGVYFYNSSSYHDWTFGSLCNNSNYGLQFSSSCLGCKITIRDVCNNSLGVYMQGICGSNIDITNANNNLTIGLQVFASYQNYITCTNAKNNGTYGLDISSTPPYHNRFVINTADNATAGINQGSGINYLNKSSIAEATEVTAISAYSGGELYSTLHDNTAMTNKIYMYGATITSQSAVKQTVSGVAWKISPTSTSRNSLYPVILPIARVAVDAGSAVTVTAWFLRDSVDITGKMVCRKGQVSGITTDVTDTITAGIDTWEQLSVSFTPTESGVVEIEAWAYGGTTNSVYVDSVVAS